MLDRTEGIDPKRLNYPLIHRNLPAQMDTDDDYDNAYSPAFHDDGLVLRISPNNYHILYEPGTSDWFLQSVKQQKKGLGAYEEIKQARKKGLKALVEDKDKNVWLKDATEGEAQNRIEEFVQWLKVGPAGVRPELSAVPAAEDGGDQIMGGL